jgi:hypothetical protein
VAASAASIRWVIGASWQLGSDEAVPKRPKFSRWRRLPGVFRSGENRPIDTGSELDRIILYVPARILDLAEKLAEKAGVTSIQDYCALLLMQALENERVRGRVADYEARRGPLKGLKEIADDPDYLAEWQQRSEPKAEPPATATAQGRTSEESPGVGQSIRLEADLPDQAELALEARLDQIDDDPDRGTAGLGEAEPDSEPRLVQVPIVITKPVVTVMSAWTSTEILGRHVRAGEDERGFLPCLRRGEAVPPYKADELHRALDELESELRGRETIDRGTAHLLHRLALESQVLLTDAWPGAFDDHMITVIRQVQESVERILSGQDIRYYPTAAESAAERPS